ncbi:MAG: sensor histidine kinase [Ruminococcus sp.]
MITYYGISSSWHIFFGICVLLLMIISVSILVDVCVLRLRKRYILLSAVLLLEVMFLLQGFADVCLKTAQGQQFHFFSDIIGNMPVFALVLWFVLSAVGEAVFLVYIRHTKKNILTAGAIKESLDALPDGVCFYRSDGQPMLVNTQMNKISGELFGTEIMNANSFINNLQMNKSESKAKIISTEPTLVIQTDEKIWDFRSNTLSVGSSEVQELVAYDVTGQYLLNQELDLRNKRLSSVNERLRRYSNDVERITTEKEILNAKMKVHDDIGRSLLAFRSYLAKPESQRDIENVQLLWRYTISVMKKEAVSDVRSNDWDLLLKAAKAVDVTVELNGELPEKGDVRHALIASLHECLTNTVKHAKGNRLYMNIHTDKSLLIAEITNNGTQPDGEIKETGGLKNLRHMVESAGGFMTVETKPQFRLVLRFQGGE